MNPDQGPSNGLLAKVLVKDALRARSKAMFSGKGGCPMPQVSRATLRRANHPHIG